MIVICLLLLLVLLLVLVLVLLLLPSERCIVAGCWEVVAALHMHPM
jgi:hypothetical protein